MTDQDSRQSTNPRPTSGASAFAPPSPKPIGKGWERSQVTIKLTPRRKSLICDIALGMPNGTTPSDAIERALEIAWNSRSETDALNSRMESIEDTIEAADGERRREADRALNAIADLSETITRLHRLLLELSSDE